MNALKEINTSALKLLQNGLQNSFEVNVLAKFCLKISKSYLNVKFENLSSIIANHLYSLDEIALDSVVGLFHKNGETGEYAIIKSFKNWQYPIFNEQQADFFVHKIVWNRTEQQLTKVYQEVDPFFSKILTAVKYIIKSRGYEKVNYFGQVLILKHNYQLLNARIIDKENFDAIPTEVFAGKLDDQIYEIINFIEKETDFIPAIPLNLFIGRIKLLKMNNFVQDGCTEWLHDFDDEFWIKNLIDKSLSKIYDKLDYHYSNKEKFTKTEIFDIKNSLKQYSIDLSNGGISKSLYDYLLEAQTKLTAEIFYSKYYTVMYYLVKELKKEIVEKLEKKEK